MTCLDYLLDTYQTVGRAQLLAVQAQEEERIVVLDRTIFYPQGGGQPCDTGTIQGNQGRFAVTAVKLQVDGQVFHYGQILEGDFQIGEEVSLQIDPERRMLHARVHSAGHLLDVAVSEVLPHLCAGKSYHFPEGPYVEYLGACDNPEQRVEELQRILDRLVAAAVVIESRMLDANEALKRGIHAPPGKAARFVSVKGYESIGCGCGGTHVRSSAEVTGLKVRKISSKKGVTRICYAL